MREIAAAPQPLTRPATCPEHGDYEERGINLLGHRTIWTGCPACNQAAADKEAARQRAIDEAAAQRRMEDRLDVSGIPLRFRDRTFATFQASSPEQERAREIAQDFADHFDRHRKQGTFLVFSGNPGTGKSHLAIAAGQAVLNRSTVAYLRVSDMIRTVRGTWRRDAERSEDATIRTLGDVGLLILDEVGVQSGTDNEQNILFDVLDRRYANCRPTILLTNLPSKEFREFVGERLFDRMKEIAVWVPFKWDSYRGTARD